MNKIYISFLAIIVLLSSCNDFLEIDPETQLPSEQALTTGNNVEATLMASYNQLASGDFLGGRVQLYSELMSDNFLPLQVINPTDFTGQIITRNTNSVNVDVDNLWSSAYRAIARANAVIDAVDNNTVTDNTPQTSLSQWRGEALFIRAVAHFELLRLFAQPYSNNPASDPGIPIRTRLLTEDEKVSRASVAEVYTQVIADLQAAIDLLPTENGNRASQWAVKGYLARVYFNQLDYENAFTTAQDIVENSGITLSGNAFSPFRNVGNVNPQGGVVFQLVTGFNAFGGYIPANNNYALTTGSGSLQEIILGSVNDIRSNTSVDGMIAETSGNLFTNKWNTNAGINMPVIRIAEIYLIHAESALLKGSVDNAAAQNSFNTLRGFYVSPYTNTTDTGDALLQRVRSERRIELSVEGDRLHELKRLKVEGFGEITDIRSAVNYNDSALLLQIPFSEISGNPGMVQN